MCSADTACLVHCNSTAWSGENPEDLLRTGQTIQIQPVGWSMYPMFVPNRDWAVLEPIEDAGKLKRGDIVLFRRAGSILVMHRIYRVTGKTGLREFWFVGDNQPAVEKGIRQEQLCGILTHFIRNGRQHSVREPGYLIISGLWLWLRPLRPLFHVCMKFFRRVGKNRGAGHNRGK